MTDGIEAAGNRAVGNFIGTASGGVLCPVIAVVNWAGVGPFNGWGARTSNTGILSPL